MMIVRPCSAINIDYNVQKKAVIEDTLKKNYKVPKLEPSGTPEF